MSKIIYERILEVLEKDDNAVIATVVFSHGSAPRDAMAKMLIFEDGTTFDTIGGGKVELYVMNEAKKIIGTGKSKMLEYDLTSAPGGIGMACGGRMKIFIEDVNKMEKVIMFGGGHIAVPLVNMAKELEFDVTVVDDRADFANKKRFKNADKIINKDFIKAFDELKIDKRTYIVIASYSHKTDMDILRKCLEYEPKYLGMIGSKRKTKLVFDTLLKEGFSKSKLSKVKSPIGIPIDAETPAEIAVSILAEVVKIRCG